MRLLERFRPAAIGMDIDRQSIKAVQVAKEGGFYVLQHVGYRRLTPGAIVDGEVADHDLLAAEVKEFWETHSFRGRNVFLGVANQKVVVRLLDFPRMSPEDLRGAINFEAQDHIPMPVEEAVLDYVVLGPQSEDSDLDRILIVAAQKDMIGRYTSALRAGGLRASGVDVKALSLVRSTLPNSLFDDEGAALLLDVSSEVSNLVVVQGALPTLTRSVPGGTVAFAQSVADSAEVSEEEADRLMYHRGVYVGYGYGADAAEQSEPEGEGEVEGALDPALAYDARRGLEEAIRVLAEDVQRSIEYHYSQPAAQDVTRIFVSGEGAMVKGMDGYLGELLGVATQPGRPLEKLSANQSNVPDEQLRVMEPVLAVALGLAVEEA